MNILTKTINDIYDIVNHSRIEDAENAISRYSGCDAATLVEALAHLVVVQTHRLKHAQGKLEEMEEDIHGEG